LISESDKSKDRYTVNPIRRSQLAPVGVRFSGVGDRAIWKENTITQCDRNPILKYQMNAIALLVMSNKNAIALLF